MVMIDWQPIKTCPNGRIVLLHFKTQWRYLPVIRVGTIITKPGATHWAPLNMPSEEE